MSYQSDSVDRLLAPEFIEGVEELPMDEVRAKRDECQRAEFALSYLRRLLQGRLDIIGAEVERRKSGESGDVSELIDRLPEILAGRAGAVSPQHRSLTTLAGVAAGVSDTFDVELSSIAGVQEMASNLSALGDEELGAVAAHIQATEAQVSSLRRAIHERIKELQAQIVVRYKSGEANEANIDALLNQGRNPNGQGDDAR